MRAIVVDDNGWIRTRYNGGAPNTDADWIEVPDSDWPDFTVPDVADTAVADKLFYRPETPNDTPPDEFNDDPGPSKWHAQSTATIGIVFEHTPE